jgi:hypothetical protein
VALVSATLTAFLASYIGGGFGFVMGYVSALAPVGLVGLGTVAPGLISGSIALVQTRFDENYRRSLAVNAASIFLAGYACGASLIDLKADDISNLPVFFDKLAPPPDAVQEPVPAATEPFAAPANASVPMNTSAPMNASAQIKSQGLSRGDLDALAVRALAGAVGECMKYGKSTGASAGLVKGLQVNTMLSCLSPPL